MPGVNRHRATSNGHAPGVNRTRLIELLLEFEQDIRRRSQQLERLFPPFVPGVSRRHPMYEYVELSTLYNYLDDLRMQIDELRYGPHPSESNGY